MDPLSITASTIAIIQIADKIISVCKDYITTVKDAPSDLRTILIEVGSVKCIIEVLQLLVSEDTGGRSEILRKLESTDGPVAGCKQALTILENQLPKPQEYARGAKRRKLDALAWPFKEPRARKALEDIGRHKATISLALTTETTHDLKIIQKKVDNLCEKMNGKERSDILNWIGLQIAGASYVYLAHWLTGSPEYKDWRRGVTGCLWLHGIPGAGKTILSSYVIKDMKAFCKNSTTENSACVYYYCYHLRGQDETVHLLRWVVGQLCRKSQHIPNYICEAYNDGERPIVEELLFSIKTLLRYFVHVYLVVDALDESHDRSNLLDIIARLNKEKGFENLHLMITSRKEVDIERVMRDISIRISLSNPRVDEDIKLFIQSHLEKDRRFSNWTKELKSGVEAALVEKAKGMFRWAFCQLDCLGRLKTVPDIQKALGELPETLDETYERILSSIPITSHKYVHKALQFLAFDFQMDLEEVAEAAVVDVEHSCFKLSDRLLHAEDLLDMCTCLISYNPAIKPNVVLAHYSVREYLESERVKPTTFQIHKSTANLLAAKSLLIYLLDAQHVSADENLLWHYAAENWLESVHTADFGGVNTEVTDLILRLLDPCEAHFTAWTDHSRKHDPFFPLWDFTKACKTNTTLAYLCYFELVGPAEVLLLRHPERSILENRIEGDEIFGGPPLQVALQIGRPNFVRLLIEKGADIDYISDEFLSLLSYAFREDSFNRKDYMTEILLNGGANPKLYAVAKTPLQVATLNIIEFRDETIYVQTNLAQVQILRLLLEGGVKVNGVGSDEAISAYIRNADSSRDSHQTEKALFDRGKEHNYDTPMRIIEECGARKKDEIIAKEKDQIRAEELDQMIAGHLKEIIALLKSYGGKSLHLFPVKGLPGYVEEDMEEFARISEHQDEIS